jgi:hypothetical protein
VNWYVEYSVDGQRGVRRTGPYGEQIAHIQAAHISKQDKVSAVRLRTAEEVEKEFIVNDDWDDEAMCQVQDLTNPLRRRGLVRASSAESHGLRKWAQGRDGFKPIVAGNVDIEAALQGDSPAPAQDYRILDRRADDDSPSHGEDEVNIRAEIFRIDVDNDDEARDDVVEAEPGEPAKPKRKARAKRKKS